MRQVRFLVAAAMAAVLAGGISGRSALGLGQAQYVEFAPATGSFAVVNGAAVAPIYVDGKDWPGVIRAAKDLSNDIKAVTGKAPAVVNEQAAMGAMPIIVGTLGKSAIIDQLVAAKKIDVSKIKGKWESSFTQVVEAPMPGVQRALVICGSDKRGTIYGIYDLSEQAGQSPWYYWGDVPAKKHEALFVKAGKVEVGEPSVKYRGIFFNDEAPALTNCVKAKYGNAPGYPQAANYGHEFYSHVFELLLRAKGNYLWPAMWSNAFNEDDPQNAPMADMYGIVMGTSHQEAMLRAQKEWDRKPRDVTGGNWNFATHQEYMEQFWRDGLNRNKDYESILTMGLRGENDTAMVQGQAQAIALLNKVIPSQRQIIKDVLNPDVTKVPQMWCLYKEVQDYYEANAGLDNPPDDITLLWAEDNNGNIRRLPTDAERKRSGGAGIYYHFDYHGSPTDYRWVNTSPIPKIWDQMSLAKQYGADRIWIVNVGKFKNLEFAIDYWLNLGWDSNRWTNDNTMEYTQLWATREFGPEHANEIAQIMAQYTRFNGRRKPERLTPETYSAANYHEAETMAADYNTLLDWAKQISEQIPEDQKDAYYELVLFPVEACANLADMYVAAGMNHLYAQQGRASANDYRDMAMVAYNKDAALMKHFNTEFAGGKWNHFQDDVHIGYTTWSEPNQPSPNQLRLTQVNVGDAPAMGVAVENTAEASSGNGVDLALPAFNAISRQNRSIDVFNKGGGSVDFTATPSAPWIVVSKTKGSTEKDERLMVSIDWAKAPAGRTEGTVVIKGTGQTVNVAVTAEKPADVTRQTLSGFMEDGKVVSIEPEHYSRKTDQGDVKWIRVEGYGKTLSAMRVQGPVNFAAITPGAGTPSLEYKVYFLNSGAARVITAMAPNVAFIPGRDLRYAVSIDDGAPQMVTAVPKTLKASGNVWDTQVRDEAGYAMANVQIPSAGYHTVKLWAVDPGITIQKILIDLGGMRPSYMGPPESYHKVN